MRWPWEKKESASPIIEAAPSQINLPPRDFGVLNSRGINRTQAQVSLGLNKNRVEPLSRMSNEALLELLETGSPERLREVSKYFARTNGIYFRAVNYLAEIYRFDYLIYPIVDTTKGVAEKDKSRLGKRLNVALEHFDLSDIQLMLRKWALTVCIEGAYYGYIAPDVTDRLVVQDLPIDYCRTRFNLKGRPLVEFNVAYFDKITSDLNYRDQILNIFPEEFKIAYLEYKESNLRAEFSGDQAGWIILDAAKAFKIGFMDRDTPPFLSAIPSLINLEEIQDLEKEKLLQELQKILVQTFELDKNGQLPFTTQELGRLNQNANDMVADAVGVNVLSTVGKIHLEDLAPKTGVQSQNNTEIAQNTVYNKLGISSNLFNTEGNLALEKSIVTDSAFAKQLLLQFESFLNFYIDGQFNRNASKLRLRLLETTIYNYKELSDTYRNLTTLGFSRLLPLVALGHSQKEAISLVRLEQDIMGLDDWMLPPFSSNTMSPESAESIKAGQKETVSNPASGSSGGGAQEGAGRPEKPDDEKSEKTIANRESLG